MLRLSAAGASALGVGLGLPGMAVAAGPPASGAGRQDARLQDPYADLLRTWCDGLIAHQQTAMKDSGIYGGLLCPACTLIHGRCGDAVYPLLRVAHTTGEARYVNAALLVHEWSEQQVSRADGSWVNDVTLSPWKGITVFHAISLGEALHHHGAVLDAPTRRLWTDRLARAAKFLDGFITIQTGNINYPVTSCYTFALCAKVLGEPRYLERARRLAHTVLDYFTPNGFLYGEGHPLKAVTPKGCHPVDLGYNVEESLPSLAQYALLADDKAVLEQTVKAMRTHMEFMLPNGAWDNSWGTRNYKWSWWGSRTSDGCHPAFTLLSAHDPRFAEVARRNAELMAACTHEGLLYGGPDYFAHGDLPCIHHTFTHAKAVAAVLDGGAGVKAGPSATLPRDEAYGIRSYPEIGTHLAAVGDWRATVTEYDWAYVEDVQKGGASGGGHVSGGALSMLYHRALGPVCVASMTEYEMIEISNQQAFRDAPHMPLTPRIEYTLGKAHGVYTNLNDFGAVVTAAGTSGQAEFHAGGRLLDAARQAAPGKEASYRVSYRIADAGVEITASANVPEGAAGELRFVLPVVSQTGETVEQPDKTTVRISKHGGRLLVSTSAAQGFDAVPAVRTFNLVPGLECAPLVIRMKPAEEVRIRLELQ